MKKTMFITSVIMVVVMAIALTTSSLAWFSATGDATVTTNAFQVTAKSETVEGLAISKNGTSGWSDSVTLDADGTNLMPLVPLTGASHYDSVNSSWDFTEADFVKTFVAYDSVNDKYGDMSISMKGNKLGNNNLFKGEAYSAGYFTDTFYVTNTAVGSTAKAVNLACDIDFYCPDGTAYNETNRIANVYALDATLNVAVFYAVNRFEADDAWDSIDMTDEAAVAAQNAALAADDTWKLLAFNTSKGDSYVNLGRTAEGFAQGQNASQSYGPWTFTSNLADGTRYTDDDAKNAIRPDRSYDGEPVARDTMLIKVVAWYDGATLINNNAANANLKFGLTFSKQASTYAD